MKKILSIFLIFSLIACTKEPELVTNKDNTDNIYYDSVVDIFDEYIPMMNTMVRLKATEGNANK